MLAPDRLVTGRRVALGVQEAADVARRLADALLVLDQRDADIALAMLAEADARRHRHVGLLQQQLGELQAAQMRHSAAGSAPRRTSRPPGGGIVPAGRGRSPRPARRGACDRCARISLDAVLRPVQRRGRGHLDRREGAVVEIGLHPRQRRDQPLVADREAHAPAGHRIGLRHGGELHRDVLGARHLQDRGRRLVVEIDLRIGEVGQDADLVLLRERHELLVEIEVGHIGGRVGRIADDQRHRLRDRVAHRALERAKKSVVGRRPACERIDAAGHDEAEGVDRIGRVGHQHDVAGRGDRLRRGWRSPPSSRASRRPRVSGSSFTPKRRA